MTDDGMSRKDPLDHLDKFRAMADQRKAQIDPPWHEGFGSASFPFVVGLFFLLAAWAMWGRETVDDSDFNPVLTLIIGFAGVAYGLAQRHVRIRVQMFGVLVDGAPVAIDWADRTAIEKREASKEHILAEWRRRHPNSEVELVALWHAWVYVPRHVVEYAGAKNLTSR